MLRVLLACAVAMSSPSGVALAGEAADRFQVSVTLLPTGPGSCTTLLEDDGSARVSCQPAVVTTASADRPVATENVLGYRLPDTRVKLAGAAVEVGEESMNAWGEYSSRLILAGGVEYVEMTVTW